MKNRFILIALLIVVFTACHSDDDSTTVYLTATTYNIDYKEQTLYISVRDPNTRGWEFAFEDSWITPSIDSGDSTRTFELYVDANTSFEERSTYGILKFYENGAINYDTLTVYQDAEELQVYLPENTVTVSSSGGIIPFKIASNMPYGLYSKPTWLEFLEARALEIETKYLDVEANPLYGYREGYVIFVHDDDADVTDSLYVFQYGVGDMTTDSLALVDLYNSTNGSSWTNKWDLSEPVTSWYGVTVESVGSLGIGKRVVSLSLGNNNLVGTIPSTLVNAAYIEILKLNDNSISGTIPSDIGTMLNLTTLYLYNNQLTGEIPSTIGGCYKLDRLHLYNNELSGAIPESIGNMTELEALGLHNNNLKYSLPESIGYLEELYTLTLYNNRLSGTIPNSYIENEQCSSWDSNKNICPQQDGYGFLNCEALDYEFD